MWTGAVNSPTRGRKSSGGYARFFHDSRQTYAHRFAYETWVGPIPEGMVIDHLCRNRRCVNVSHLEAVTVEENIRRGAQGLHNAVKSTCKRGHAFDPRNTYVYTTKEGYTVRHCRACRAQWNRDYRKDEA